MSFLKQISLLPLAPVNTPALAIDQCKSHWVWLKFWRIIAWRCCTQQLPYNWLQRHILGFAGMFEFNKWEVANRALVCHSRRDPATLPFSKVTHVCLSPAVRVVIWLRVVRVGPQCVIMKPCMPITTSCPSPGQLKGGFETASWIVSLCKLLGLALAIAFVSFCFCCVCGFCAC